MKTQIHFLNTYNSDCIILESNGHYAMIDAAEDNDYPVDMPHLKAKGYENEIIDYLIKNCAGPDGKVTLDFILGTHCHSDHIGGFDTIILNSNIVVKKAYLKHYEDSNVFIMERKRWDNQTVYRQMLNALKYKNVPVVEEFEGVSEKLGDFDITFYNGKYQKQNVIKLGENVNSVVTKVTAFGKTALLMGDMNYKKGYEQKIGKHIGNVDVLKVGHHGYVGSTSLSLVKSVKPKVSIVTNSKKRIYPSVKFKLEKIAKSKIYYTANSNGVIVEFGNDSQLNFVTDIM